MRERNVSLLNIRNFVIVLKCNASKQVWIIILLCDNSVCDKTDDQFSCNETNKSVVSGS